MDTRKDYIRISMVFFCHDKTGRFLMGKRSENCRDEVGKWDIGSRDFNLYEPAINILRKGVRDEYGIDISNYEFLGFRKINRKINSRNVDEITFDFKVLIDNIHQAKNKEPSKLEAIGWFGINNLPSSQELHSQLPAFLKNYKNKLR